MNRIKRNNNWQNLINFIVLTIFFSLTIIFGILLNIKKKEDILYLLNLQMLMG